MDQQSPDQFEQFDQPKRGMSTGMKVGIGCAVAIVLAAILVCGGIATWYFYSWGQYQNFAAEFEQQGYTLSENTAISVERPMTGPVVFLGQAVNIETEIDGNVAIAARAANINGTIDGDLDFYGMVLNIDRNARITGEVRVRSANAVNIEGTVEGEVTGQWDVIEDQRGQQPQSPDEDQNEDPQQP